MNIICLKAVGKLTEEQSTNGRKQFGIYEQVRNKKLLSAKIDQNLLLELQFNGISTVSPTSSSADSYNDTLLIDFSFSTSGGAGTSILDGVIIEAGRFEASLVAETGDFFNGSISSNAEEGTVAGSVCAAGGWRNR